MGIVDWANPVNPNYQHNSQSCEGWWLAGNASFYGGPYLKNLVTRKTAKKWTLENGCRFAGGALYFDGSGASCLYNATLFSGNSLTMTAMIYLLSYQTNTGAPDYYQRVIIDSYNPYSSDAHGMSVYNTSLNTFINWDGSVSASNRANILGTTIPLKVWHHVAMTAGGGRIRCYQNGVLTGSGSYTDAGLVASATWRIGSFANRASLTGAWHGYINDVRVYSAELSGAAVTDLSSQARLGNKRSLNRKKRRKYTEQAAVAASSMLLRMQTEGLFAGRGI